MLADARKHAVLADVPLAVTLTDARASAVLALASLAARNNGRLVYPGMAEDGGLPSGEVHVMADSSIPAAVIQQGATVQRASTVPGPLAASSSTVLGAQQHVVVEEETATLEDLQWAAAAGSWHILPFLLPRMCSAMCSAARAQHGIF